MYSKYSLSHYLEASKIIIPDSQDFLSLENIVEPLTGDYYFTAGEIQEESEPSDGLTIGIICTTLLIVVIVLKRNRD